MEQTHRHSTEQAHEHSNSESRPHSHASSHSHAHGHHHHHHGTGAIGTAFFLNLTFTIIEIIGGLWSNSLAILSDAIHDLGDCVALGLTWYFEKISYKGRDATYTYGYRRWSVAAGLISSMLLLFGSVFIVSEALPRLWAPEPVKAPAMILLAIVGVAMNGLAVLRLKEHHSAGEKAAYLHLLEDVLGWVAVLIGAIILYFTHWNWVDPLLSLGVSLFILRNVFINIKSFTRVLLQAVPEGCDPAELKAQIEDIVGVQTIHDLHVWTLDSNQHVLSMHVVMAADASREDMLRIKYEAKNLIRQAGIGHETLEMEYADEPCHGECDEPN